MIATLLTALYATTPQPHVFGENGCEAMWGSYDIEISDESCCKDYANKKAIRESVAKDIPTIQAATEQVNKYLSELSATLPARDEIRQSIPSGPTDNPKGQYIVEKEGQLEVTVKGTETKTTKFGSKYQLMWESYDEGEKMGQIGWKSQACVSLGVDPDSYNMNKVEFCAHLDLDENGKIKRYNTIEIRPQNDYNFGGSNMFEGFEYYDQQPIERLYKISEGMVQDNLGQACANKQERKVSKRQQRQILKNADPILKKLRHVVDYRRKK